MLIAARSVPLGGLRAMQVRRTLPTRQRTTIGAWCFLDRFGPGHDEMLVLPHPHIGLQTVTWPLEGTVHHRDSVGSDVQVKPGELNLMTAGRGISHSEVSLGGGVLSGVQLWVAQPDDSRHGANGFEQHTDLPQTEGTGWHAQVLMGTLQEQTSPATTFSPLVGAQVTLSALTCTMPTDPAFEYGVLPLDESLTVNGTRVEEGDLWYVEPGREVTVTGPVGRRFMLIGGEPFEESLVMWWNFVGRTHEDIVQAREEWEAAADRFGTVAGHGSERIPAPPMPRTRLLPRSRSRVS